MANFSEILNIAVDAAKNPTITDDQFKKICEAIDDKITNAWFNNHIDMDTHCDLTRKLNRIKNERLDRDHHYSSSSKSNNFLQQMMQEQMDRDITQQHIQMQMMQEQMDRDITQQHIQMQMNQQMQMFM